MDELAEADTAAVQQQARKRGRPPSMKKRGEEGSSGGKAQKEGGQASTQELPPQPPLPPPANPEPDPAMNETAQKYSSLMQAASWIHTPCVRLNARNAFLLGGHISGLEALFVRCVCPECLAQSSSGACVKEDKQDNTPSSQMLACLHVFSLVCHLAAHSDSLLLLKSPFN